MDTTLQDIDYPEDLKYASDSEFIPLEFFINTIPLAKTIDIRLGYFSTSSIHVIAPSFAQFIYKGGMMRIITNHFLSESDKNLLTNQSKVDFSLVKSKVENDLGGLSKLFETSTQHFYNCLRYLLDEEMLSIFPVMLRPNKMVHYKDGIISDGQNIISFTGSCNFTFNGLIENAESIVVSTSWSESFAERKRITNLGRDIDSICKKKNPNFKYLKPEDITVTIREKSEKKDLGELLDDESTLRKELDVNSRVKRILKEQRIKFNIQIDKEVHKDSKLPQIPNYFLTNGRLRNHQEEAIRNWFLNNGVGIFHMATGSGKTVTALSTVSRLLQKIIEKGEKLGIIVTVPYKHLADQWFEESKKFGFKPITCYGNYKKWINEVNNEIININSGISKFFFIITSNATFIRNKFQNIISEIQFPFVFVADEMHNLGGKKISTVLPENARFRIGLSATPNRHLDELGTTILYDFFGKTIINYGIKEAINDGTLCRYNYYPILISFTESELEEYKDISLQIVKAYGYARKKLEFVESEFLKRLLIKRSRIIANADNKILKLKELLIDKKDTNYNLIYCGDEIEYTQFGQDQNLILECEVPAVKQVEKILNMIGSEIGMRANKFTAQENQEKRRKILKQFGESELQALVAIRCLDEGVDIPRTENAYILASSSNPRQFIQRRGRVLRKAEGKNRANIYDFIVIPDESELINLDSFNIERNLLIKELKRVNEFASISENHGHTLNVLRKIKLKYNLLDY